MTYDEALRYLGDLSRFGVSLGLQRVERLLYELGNPEKDLRCIHVAGTNGKGSVTAMVSSVLTQAGYRVGRYTSPHLASYTERICINGEEISQEDFASFLDETRSAIVASNMDVSDPPTEFEVLTVMAFKYFREKKVDFAVIEVGLGGRLDATNVVNPIVSVITHIGYDHVDRLGSTLSEIASEKCGIIKKGVPVVCGRQEPEAFEVIQQVAEERGSMFWAVDRDALYEVVSQSMDGSCINVWGNVQSRSKGLEVENIFIPLTGVFQPENCICAVGAIWMLREAGVEIGPDVIRRGVAEVKWPARFEIINRHPLIILDAGHNLDAAERLRETIKLLDYDKMIMVTGLLRDKDAAGYLRKLASSADMLVATRPSSPRAFEADELGDIAEGIVANRLVIEDPINAVDTAVSLAGENDFVLVCGSFYLAGAVREYMMQKYSGDFKGKQEKK